MQERNAGLPEKREQKSGQRTVMDGKPGALERSGKRDEKKTKRDSDLADMDDGFGVGRLGRRLQLFSGTGGAGKTGGAGR